MTTKFPHVWSYDGHRRPCPIEIEGVRPTYWAECKQCKMVKAKGCFFTPQGLVVARSTKKRENPPVCTKGKAYILAEARLRELFGV